MVMIALSVYIVQLVVVDNFGMVSLSTFFLTKFVHRVSCASDDPRETPCLFW